MIARAGVLDLPMLSQSFAFELGYQDRSNFEHAFNRLAGCSPSVHIACLKITRPRR